MVIFHHPPDVQVFKGNQIIVVHQISADFVSGVFSLIGYVIMAFGQHQGRFSPTMGALLSSGNHPLDPFQLSFRLTKILGVVEILLIRGHS
jgi:hypothetical protein